MENASVNNDNVTNINYANQMKCVTAKGSTMMTREEK